MYPDEPRLYKYAYSVDDDYEGAVLNVKEASDEYATHGSYEVNKRGDILNHFNKIPIYVNHLNIYSHQHNGALRAIVRSTVMVYLLGQDILTL